MAYTPVTKPKTSAGYTPVTKRRASNFTTLTGEKTSIPAPTELVFRKAPEPKALPAAIAGIVERANAVVASIKQRSLTPLKESFKQQFSEEMYQPARIEYDKGGVPVRFVPGLADTLAGAFAGDGGGRRLPKKAAAAKGGNVIKLPETPLSAPSQPEAPVYTPITSRNGNSSTGARTWPDTTASRPSKADGTSTGSAPTGKEGVSTQSRGTSGPFEGQKLYHGTQAEFDTFDIGKAGTRNPADQGFAGRGIYLTNAREVAEDFAGGKDIFKTQNGAGKGRVIEATLSPDAKVLEVNSFKEIGEKLGIEGVGINDGRGLITNIREKAPLIQKKAIEQGYDAIKVDGGGIAANGERAYEIVVFNPSKLKQSSPSIPKELEPLAAEARSYLYHRTSPKNLESIAREGLQPGKPGSLGDVNSDRVWLSPSDNPSARFGGSEAVKLRVKQGAVQNPVKGVGELYTQNGIAPKDIEIFRDGKWQSLTDVYTKATGGTPTGDRPFPSKGTTPPAATRTSDQTKVETPSNTPVGSERPQIRTTQAPSPSGPLNTSPAQPQSPTKLSYGGTVPQDVYKANRTRITPSRLRTVKDGLGAALTSAREGADKLLGPISTRLKNIDPTLKQAMRQFEFKLGSAMQADRRAVAPFIEGIRNKRISKEDYADLDLALKNGDGATIDAIVSKYGLEKEFAEIRTVLNNLYARAKDVGYDIGYIENYFPRMVEDADGLLAHFGKGDDWSVIDEAIKGKETDLGRYLTTDEKAHLINTLMRGYDGKIALSKTSNMKGRRIELIDGDLNRFYRDSVETLLRYVDRTNEAIEARRFFGKGPKTDQFANLDDSIGAYIVDLLSKGTIKPSQEKELRDILRARFGQLGTSGVIKVYKNLSYIDTMGSFTSAITQIGDLAFALYKGGPVQTVKALGKAIAGKSDITRADLGIEKIAQEFEDASRSAQAVDKVFRLIGLHKMDTLGKETVINATIGKYRKLAESPTSDFLRRVEAVFGKDTGPVLDDLKAGRITEDVKLLAFNELLDVQPVTLSEMPEQYLKGGNGRIFYMLKTYTVKLFDVYRNEIFHEIAAGNKVQGLKNLMYLTGALVAMNATADEIKDLMLNRETPLEDRTVDNILKLAGFSKFTIYKARQEGIGSAVAKTILPPFKAIDAAYKDMTQGEFDETVQSIPVGGKLYYWWFGKGAEKSDKKREKAAPRSGPSTPELPPLPPLPPLPKMPSLPRL